jgi:Chaperone of endosialidase
LTIVDGVGGRLYVGTGGTYETGKVPDIKSDLRLKKDLSPIRSPLESIRRLNGVTYKWNDEAMKYFTRDIETTVSAGPDATAEQNQVVWQRERHKQYEELSTTPLASQLFSWKRGPSFVIRE